MTASIAQTELAKVYRRERDRYDQYARALDQIVAEDFPAADAAPESVTRWHVDAMRGLVNQVAALVEGHDRQ